MSVHKSHPENCMNGFWWQIVNLASLEAHIVKQWITYNAYCVVDIYPCECSLHKIVANQFVFPVHKKNTKGKRSPTFAKCMPPFSLVNKITIPVGVVVKPSLALKPSIVILSTNLPCNQSQQSVAVGRLSKVDGLLEGLRWVFLKWILRQSYWHQSFLSERWIKWKLRTKCNNQNTRLVCEIDFFQYNWVTKKYYLKFAFHFSKSFAKNFIAKNGILISPNIYNSGATIQSSTTPFSFKEL